MKYILNIPEESDFMYYCDDLEIQAIARVLKSKKLFRYQGKDVETECSLFEKKFAAHLNSHKTILLSSGTNALVNALYSLDIQEGDEVLIPAYTFYATAAAVIELKAIPVIVNVNHFLSFDPIDLENKVTNKTKAVIAVHMDGYSCDMNYLSKFCDHHDLVLIEDCAQAVGGSYQSKKLGTIGQAGCFSFNMDKVISCGEGGALALKDEVLYQKAFLYHDTCNQFGPTSKEMYTIPKFSGKSMRVSEIQGAMINVQLDRLPTILAELKIRKKMLDEHLISLGLELIPSYYNEGECFTTSRALCADVTLTNKIILDLNKQKIKANSPMLRPAHHIWQWHHLLPQHPVQNKFGFLPSIDMLSRVLLIHVTLEGTLEEWKKTIGMIRVL